MNETTTRFEQRLAELEQEKINLIEEYNNKTLEQQEELGNATETLNNVTMQIANATTQQMAHIDDWSESVEALQSDDAPTTCEELAALFPYVYTELIKSSSFGQDPLADGAKMFEWPTAADMESLQL